MKIVVLDGYTENPGDLSWEGLSDLGTLTVYDRCPADEAEILRRIGDAEAIYVNKVPITRAILQASPALRFIGVLATGYNVVDIAAAREAGVTVTNIPTYGTAAVAQFAIALLLEICSRVGHHDRAVKAGRWTNSPDWCFWDYPLMELDGKTMGIIGLGRIGQNTAKIAASLGMRVIAFDEYPSDAGRAVATYVSLEELYAQSDVIVLHCPLFPSTHEMINRDSIAKMKDGVILINNSRGPLIREADLADAIRSGKVYAAGLDVVATEPIQADSPLLGLDNCIVTPHISWAPRESRARLMDIAVGNLRAFLNGAPVNVVS